MALLSQVSRDEVFAEIMRDARLQPGTLLKAAFSDAVNAVDQWVEDNSASYNSAIPQPARGGLTTKQKAGLLMLVVAKRYKVAV